MTREIKVKCHKIVPVTVKKPWEQIEHKLKKQKFKLKETPEKKCEVVLIVCPIVSRAGTDIEAALNGLEEQKKPAVLVVLHHTYDPDSYVPDSSRSVTRPNTLTVDCLFHEDKGLLLCNKNEEAIRKVRDWLKEVKTKTKTVKVKCHKIVPVTVKKPWEQIEHKLKKQKFKLKETPEKKCEVVLIVCSIVSRAGTDIEAALNGLKEQNKPAVLVVLHHTYDPDSYVPDSSRSVTRPNTLTVDCLFHEDKGLLLCNKNEEAIRKIRDWLKEVKRRNK